MTPPPVKPKPLPAPTAQDLVDLLAQCVASQRSAQEREEPGKPASTGATHKQAA